jgi:TDG/mug DNA glycosylase family protein
MEVLPAIVGADPVIVFCGMAGAESTKSREHYYASPGNSFWQSVHLSGLTPRQLRPEEDAWVVDQGLGLTDLVGHWDHDTHRGWVEIDLLVAQVEEWEPAFVAFTGKGHAAYAARALGHRPPGLGLTGWGIGRSEVFVLPGTSGANQRKDYDGRPTRLAWWQDLVTIAAPELSARRDG